MSWYQKGKTNLDFTGARDNKWQWHQLGHVQVCTSLHTDNHASTLPLTFLQARCLFCHPTNSVKALKALKRVHIYITYSIIFCSSSCTRKSANKLKNGHRLTINNYQFTGVLRPGQVADLWASVNTLQWPASYRIPESDASVCCATATGQQAMLVRRPRYCLHSSQMLWVCLYGANTASVPDKQLVVVASRCQMLMIWRPLQATHLTPSKQLTLWLNVTRSNKII